MLQRLQSLYLLLIVLLLASLGFVPLANISVDGSVFSFSTCGLVDSTDGFSVSLWPVCVFIGLLLLYNLVIIFFYKNRVLQIKLAKLNGILLAVLIAVVVMSSDYLSGELNPDDAEVIIDYSIGTYFTFFPLIFNYLSIKAIKKDEELVRSADRLR